MGSKKRLGCLREEIWYGWNLMLGTLIVAQFSPNRGLWPGPHPYEIVQSNSGGPTVGIWSEWGPKARNSQLGFNWRSVEPLIEL